MTREEFKAKAKEVIDSEQFGALGVLFNYESFEEMRVAQIPDGLDSAESDMPLDDFLDELYEQIKQEPILDKIRAEIERQEKWLMDAGYNAYNVDIALNAIKLAVAESEDKE